MYVPDFCATEAEFPSAEAVRINRYVWPRRNFLFEPFQVRHRSNSIDCFFDARARRSIQERTLRDCFCLAVPVPVHFLDSKALSSLGIFYLVYMLSREPTHKFHPPILGNERPLSLWKAVMAPKFCFGISGFSPQAGARMSWGSADLMPTSRPLRSEQALGSVVPSPYPPPRLAVTLTPEVC